MNFKKGIILLIFITLLTIGSCYASDNSTDTSETLENNIISSESTANTFETNDYNEYSDSNNPADTIKYYKTASGHNNEKVSEIYVNKDKGNDKSSGNNTNPYKTIDKALDKVSTSNNTIIHISHGTYSLSKTRKIANCTTLTLVGEDKDNTIINLNQHKGFILNNVTINIQKLTLTNASHSGQGGVFTIESNVSFNADDCIFTNNDAVVGGVLFTSLDYNNITITNSLFRNNSADSQGGALQVGGEHTTTLIRNCSFINNSCDPNVDNVTYRRVGGAIYSGTYGVTYVDLCNFINNTAVNGTCIFSGSHAQLYLTNSNFTYNNASNNQHINTRGTVTIASGIGNITNCYFAYNNASYGAAISINSGEEANITSCVFYSNKARTLGGAIYNYGDLNVVNCKFIKNWGSNRGGAILDKGNKNVNIINSTFTDNSIRITTDTSTDVPQGGAISISGPAITFNIDNCTFNNNSAYYGGALYSKDDAKNININNTVFKNNDAQYGGAIYSEGVGLNIRIANSAFNNNNANNNGGSIVYNGLFITSLITDTEFTNNKAINSPRGEGGAIHIGKYATITMSNTTLVNNTASTYGGAISVQSSLYLSIIKSLIKNNTAVTGGAIYQNNSVNYGVFPSTIQLKTSILVDNGGIYQVYSEKPYDSQYNDNWINWTWFGQNNVPLTAAHNFNITKNYLLQISEDNILPQDWLNKTITIKSGDISEITVFIYSVVTKQDKLTLDYSYTDDFLKTVNIEITKNDNVTYTLPLYISENIDITGVKKLDILLDHQKIILTLNNENITTIKTNIIGSDITRTIGEKVIINGSVKTSNGTLVNNGTVIIRIDDNTVAQTSVINGRYTYEYTIPSYDADKYKLTYNYIGEYPYDNSIITKTLTILKQDTKITTNNVKTYVKNTTILNGTVTTTNGTPVANGTITIKLNEKTIGETKVINGKYTYKYTIPITTTTNNIITYTYDGNSQCNSSTVSKNFTILKYKTKITAPDVVGVIGTIINFNGTVTTNNGTLVNDGIINIKLNGKTMGKTNVTKGKFTYTYTVPVFSAKNYILTYTYGGNSIYDGSTLNKTFTIKKITTKITTNNVLGVIGTTVKLNGTITTTNGTKINNGTINIKINGTTIGQTKIINGKYTYNYTIPIITAKSYTLTYTYGGNSIYDRCTTSKTIKINKQTTRITTNNVKGYVGEPVILKGTLTTTNGTKINGSVTIKLNGKTVRKVTVTNGSFSYNYVIPAYHANNYTLNYIYDGTSQYNTSSANKIFTILKHDIVINASDVSIYAGETVNLKGTVKASNGTNIMQGTVIIKFNGRVIGQANITNSTFLYKYKIPDCTAKNYTLTYTYNESTNYNSYQFNSTLNVKNQTSIIKISGVTKKSDKLKFTVQIKGSKTAIPATAGSVVYKIDGKLVKDSNGTIIKTTIRNGTVVITYTIPKSIRKGTHTLTVVYYGGKSLRGGYTSTKVTI
ncbi:hypothetical protein [Methanosphaera sp.]|uniref:hypothetical protein n=1 Tax=Methanosphaera sp. TaxID=2666342 RepID=UPI003D8C1E83